MMKKRVPLNENTNILNLDSLVDIVSNKVGILIILAVFTAMLSVIEKKDTLKKEEPITDIEKIKIPWAHSSQKNILLFLLREERLLFFDRAIVFKRLKKYLSGKKSLPKQISFENFLIKLTTGNRHANCIEFISKTSSGEFWHQVYKEKGLIQNLKKTHPPEENYFFFWVDAGSFAIFREIRESLWGENYEVGWKPIQNESILQYCSGNNQKQKFQPQ